MQSKILFCDAKLRFALLMLKRGEERKRRQKLLAKLRFKKFVFDFNAKLCFCPRFLSSPRFGSAGHSRTWSEQSQNPNYDYIRPLGVPASGPFDVFTGMVPARTLSYLSQQAYLTNLPFLLRASTNAGKTQKT